MSSRKIQNEDVKTLADITGLGGSASQLINDTKIYVTADGINKQLSQAIEDGDIGSGGGGGGTTNVYTLGGILGEILADEADTQIPTDDQFLDDFNDEAKGTKTGCAQSASALRHTGLSATYERTKFVTGTVVEMEAGLILSKQHVAFKSTAFSPSSTSTSVTVKVPGDVTDMFADTKKVLVCKYIADNDGKPGLIGLVDANKNVQPLVLGAAPSYASDETTLVISNPDALDLDFDVTSANYHDELRILPWDESFQVKSSSGASYEEMEIKNLFAMNEVRIPGENFFSELFSITGSILHHSMAKSPNEQYWIAKVLEKTSGNSTWHFGYSVNNGVSWTKFGTTKTYNASAAEEKSGDFESFNSKTMGVDDSGNAFWGYVQIQGGLSTGQGVYSDISAGTPSLSDSAATGVDSANDTGSAGWIGSFAGASGHVGSVEVKDGYVAVAIVNTSSNGVWVRWYSGGGSTHIGLSSTSYTQTGTDPFLLFVNGTGSSHRTTLITHRNDTGQINQAYWDQGSTTAVASAVIYANNDTIIAGQAFDDRIYVLTKNDSDSNVYLLRGSNVGFSLTPSWSTRLQVLPSSLTPDLFNGWNAAANRRLWKTLYSRIAIDPNDEKQIQITYDATHPDGIRRSTLIEVPDTTNINFAGITQFTTNNAATINELTTQARVGQTFTATASTPKLRTFSAILYQTGFVTSGSTIQADLYATSAGVPTGSSLGTSQLVDATKITKNSSGQWVHFNFNNITLTNAVVYAVVISVSYSTNASNYIRWLLNTSGGYASGDTITYNSGTTTYSISSGIDQVFMISDAYVTTIGKAIESGANRANFGFHDQESQIVNIDSNTAQVSFRRALTTSDAMKQLSGHPFRRVLTWGTGGAQSTLSSIQVAGYAPTNYDEHLVFAVAPGYDDSKRQNVSTGVLNNDAMMEDRSGANIVTSAYTNITSADVVADSDFQSGYAIDFDGSSESIQYTDTSVFDLYFNKPFCIEVELKPTSLGTQTVLSHFSTGPNSGWVVNTSATGYLELIAWNSSGTTICRLNSATGFLANSTYGCYRIVWDGSGSGAPKMYKSTTYNGTFTESGSYTISNSFTSGNTSSSATFVYGSERASTQWYNGRGGYLKFSNGSNTFAYQGYKAQPPLVGHLNLGKMILAENKLGENSATSGTNFDNAGMILGDANSQALVDSNDIFIKLKKAIAGTKSNNPHFKWTGGRVSTRDVSAIESLNVRFLKDES